MFQSHIENLLASRQITANQNRTRIIGRFPGRYSLYLLLLVFLGWFFTAPVFAQRVVPGVGPSNLTIAEGETGSYNVVLRDQPREGVPFIFHVSNPDANVHVATVSPTTLTFTNKNWNKVQTITVRAVEDDNALNEEVFFFFHTTSGSYHSGPRAFQLRVKVDDDETAGVSFSPTVLTVDEGGNGAYTIVLHNRPASSVAMVVRSGGAVTVSPKGLAFNRDNWDIPQTVTVTGVQDGDINDDTARLTHEITSLDVSYDRLIPAISDVTVNVIDDDTVGVTVTPTVLTVGETGHGTYTLVLDTQPPGDVVIKVTSDNTRVARLPFGNKFTFRHSNWNIPQTVTMLGVDDSDVRDDSTSLRHAITADSSTLYRSVTPDPVAVTVVDRSIVILSSDYVSWPGRLNIREGESSNYMLFLSAKPAHNVTLTVTSDVIDVVTVTSPLVFTPLNWNSPRTVTVTGVEDENARNESLSLIHTMTSTDPDFNLGVFPVSDVSGGRISLTVMDNDTAGVTVGSTRLNVAEGGTGGYTVMLTSQPTDDVEITVRSDTLTAATVPLTPLRFTAENWDSAQIVTVTGVNDADANDASVVLSHTTSSSDSQYDAGAITISDVTVTVTDDDTAGVTLSDSTLRVEEGETETYTLVLRSQPSVDVTIAVMKEDTAGAVTVRPTTPLTFTRDNWHSAQTVTVTSVEDADANDETVRVNHTATSEDNAYNSAVVPLVTVNVTDDETASVIVSPTIRTITEGETGTYRLVLSSQPSVDVTIAVMKEDTAGAVTVRPTTPLTFTRDNWHSAQTVTVTSVEDADANDETVRVNHTMTSEDNAYNSAVVPLVTVNVTDDETASVIVSPTIRTITEGGTGTYTLVLSSQPTDEVEISVRSDTLTAATVPLTPLRFTAENWNSAQIVTVTGVDDADANDASVVLSHTTSSSDSQYDAGAITISDVTVTVTDDDTAGVMLSDSRLTVSEAGTASYRVQLNTQPTDEVEISVRSDTLTAATVPLTPLRFTAENWNSAQIVTVTGVDDADANDASVVLSHTTSSSDSQYDAGAITISDVTVTVTDDDTAGVMLSDSRLTVSEAGTASYRVQLNTQPTDEVEISVRSDTLAAATVPLTPLRFTAENWDSAQIVTVTGVDDADADDASVVLSHTTSSSDSQYDAGAITISDVTVTVRDNDTIGVTVTPTILVVAEDAGTASYRVQLNTQPTDEVEISVRSDTLTAATVPLTPLRFTAENWNSAQIVTVTGVDDADANDASVVLSHTTSSSDSQYDAGAITISDVTVTVTDDDTAGVMLSDSRLTVSEAGTASYRVQLNTQPTDEVEISVRSDTLAAATVPLTPLRFTAENWNSAQIVTVTGVDDADANDASVVLSHTTSSSDSQYDAGAITISDVTVTVTDDDTAGVMLSDSRLTVSEAGTASYRVQLNTQPTDEVEISVRSDTLAAATVPLTPLRFTAENWDSAQIVTVTGVDDADANDASVVLSHTTSSSDSQYDAGAITISDVTVTVTDDDTAGVMLSDSRLTVSEAGTVSYRVQLNTQPTDEVEISVRSDTLTAATVPLTPLRFTAENWNSAQIVTVTGVDDADANDASVVLSHTTSSSDSQYDAGAITISDVTVTVTDDDTAGVMLSDSRLTVSEAGTASYRVQLNTQPTDEVEISVRSDTLAAATVPLTPLRFTAENWNSAQIVTVTGVDDADANDASVVLSHTTSSSDSQYDAGAITISDVTVTVTDDDIAGVMLSDSRLTVSEAGTVSYRVQLNTQPTDEVEISVRSDTLTAATVPLTPLRFTAENWNSAQIVTVTGVDDADANDASVVLSHTTSSSDSQYDAGAITISDVTVTVTDDDTAGVMLSDSRLTVSEAGTVSYRVQLNTQPTDEVEISVRSDTLTAATVPLTPLRFTAENWNSAQIVTVTGVDDADADDASVVLSHTTSSSDSQYDAGAITISDVTVTVTDDDTAGVMLSDSRLTVSEAGTASYRVQLNTQPTDEVEISVRSDTLTAATVPLTPLRFTAENWDSAQIVTVTGVDDADANDASVVLSHTTSSSDSQYDAGAITISDVTVTVTDDDTAGVMLSDSRLTVNEAGTVSYRVQLNTQPTDEVEISVRSDTLTAATVPLTPLRFTAENWNSAQIVTVTGVNDADANDETVRVNHTVTSEDNAYNSAVVPPVTVNVTDDEMASVIVTPTITTVAEGKTKSYAVLLSSQPTDEVEISVRSDTLTAATVPLTPLRFTAENWDSAQIVTVTGVNDADANDETVRVNHTVTSEDNAYNSAVVPPVTVNVTDDEMASVIVTPTITTVAEGKTKSYAVLLSSQPSSDVVIGVSSDDIGAATATATVREVINGIQLPGGILRFGKDNWNTPQGVMVMSIEDEDANDETVRVNHTARSQDLAYNSVKVAPVVVTVTDDDTAGVTLSDSTLRVEEGETETYTLVLRSQPSVDVTIAVMKEDTAGAVTVRPTTPLTFTRDNWHSAQTVTVTSVEDADANDETVRVNHTATSEDNAYNSAVVPLVTVNVTDDETASVIVSPTIRTITEGETGTYRLVLSSQPSVDVTIAVMKEDTAGAVTVRPTTPLTFTRNNWHSAQTVTVTSAEDADANDETVRVNHTMTSEDNAYNSAVVPLVTVNVTDDETASVIVSSTIRTIAEGETGTYRLVLSSQPSADVTIAVMNEDREAATVSPTSLRFTGRNWNQPQMVTVTGVQDNDGIDKNVQLMHTVTSEDSTYDATKVIAINVTVTEMAAFNLDVDGSGGTANQSDGLIIGRYLFGIRDARGLLDAIPGNPSFSAVTANIAGAFASGLLDVDGSGGTANQSDGLLIGRYLFGIRDARGLLDTIPGNPSFSGVTTNIGGLVR